MSRPDGFYEARIIGTAVEEDTFNDGGMVACFTVHVTEGDDRDEYVCRHSDGTGDKDAKARCESVFRSLDLEFPAGFAVLDTAIGKDCRLRLKTSAKGYQNAYIATSKKAAVLSVEEINRRLAGEDEVPF